MLAGDFIRMAMDTKVIVRDRKTGAFLKDWKEYECREVAGFYGKAHRCGNPGRMQAEIVIMVR